MRLNFVPFHGVPFLASAKDSELACVRAKTISSLHLRLAYGPIIPDERVARAGRARRAAVMNASYTFVTRSLGPGPAPLLMMSSESTKNQVCPPPPIRLSGELSFSTVLVLRA